MSPTGRKHNKYLERLFEAVNHSIVGGLNAFYNFHTHKSVETGIAKQ